MPNMHINNVFMFISIILKSSYHVTKESPVIYVGRGLSQKEENLVNPERFREKRTLDSKQHACYECSNFPYEDGSLDEKLGPCPGWKREPKSYGVSGTNNTFGSSLYDGCMTIILSNGAVVSQNAVVLSQCLEYKTGDMSSTHFNIFGFPSKILCCQGTLCNGPSKIRAAIIHGLGLKNIKVKYPTVSDNVDYIYSFPKKKS